MTSRSQKWTTNYIKKTSNYFNIPVLTFTRGPHRQRDRQLSLSPCELLICTGTVKWVSLIFFEKWKLASCKYQLYQIWLNCPWAAQTCVLLLFWNRDLEINPLKLEGDLDSLKMYLHTENEAASLRHSKLRAWIGKNTKMSQGQWSRSKMSKAPNYFERYRNRYSDQAPAVSDQ